MSLADAYVFRRIGPLAIVWVGRDIGAQKRAWFTVGPCVRDRRWRGIFVGIPHGTLFVKLSI